MADLIIVVQHSERMKSRKKLSSSGKPGKNQSKPKAKAKRKPKIKPRPSRTSDILGGSHLKPRRARKNPKWARHHRNLVELREELLLQAGKLAREATEGTPTYSM